MSLPDKVHDTLSILERSLHQRHDPTILSALQTGCQLFIPTVQYIANYSLADHTIASTFRYLGRIKYHASQLYNQHHSEAIQSQSCKFLELVLLTFSFSDSLFSLYNIPPNHHTLKHELLVREASATLNIFLDRLSVTDMALLNTSFVTTLQCATKIIMTCESHQQLLVDRFSTFATDNYKRLVKDIQSKTLKNSITHMILLSCWRILTSRITSDHVIDAVVAVARSYNQGHTVNNLLKWRQDQKLRLLEVQKAATQPMETVKTKEIESKRMIEVKEEPPLKIVRKGEEEEEEIEKAEEMEEEEETFDAIINDCFLRILTLDDVILKEGTMAVVLRSELIAFFGPLLIDSPCLSDLVAFLSHHLSTSNELFLKILQRLTLLDQNLAAGLFVGVLDHYFDSTPSFSQSNHSIIVDLFLSSPILTSPIFEFLEKRSLSENESHRLVSLLSLREIVLNKPEESLLALDYIIKISTNNSFIISKSAIELLSFQLYPLEELQSQILTCATENAYELVSLQEESGLEESTVLAKTGLLFSLASQTSSLLTFIYELYSQLLPAVRRHLDEPIKSLISSHHQSEEVLQLLTSCDSDEFGTLITQSLAELYQNELPAEIIEAATTCTENGTSMVILVPFLPLMPSADLIDLLPRILIDLVNDIDTLSRLLHDILSKSTLTVAELLIIAHDLETDATIGSLNHRVLVTSRVTDFVLKSKQQVNSTTLSVVLSRLAYGFKLPKNLMLTSIRSLLLFPQLSDYLVSHFLPVLISRDFWSDDVLWEGFTRLLLLIGSDCAPILITIPIEKLEKLLSISSLFKEYGRKHIQENYLKKGKWISELIKSVFR
ncbi:hypothetical protein P9112_012580 [Eukaryota sp. TZLM1-RC]